MKDENSLMVPWWRGKEVTGLRDMWGDEFLKNSVLDCMWGGGEGIIQDNSGFLAYETRLLVSV